MASKNTLLNSVEGLVSQIVKDAKTKKLVLQPDGTSVEQPADIAERVKAADVALRYLMIKEKIAPEKEESEFERDLADFHDTGKNNGNSRSRAGNGADSHSDPD